MQSQESHQKPQFEQFFDDFQVKYLQSTNFSKKQVSFKNTVLFSTNFKSKNKKIVRAVFEKHVKVSDFGLIGDYFANISKSRIFFKNPALSPFYLYSPLSSCKKSEISLEPFLGKLHYQPTNYQQHRSYRTSLTPVQNVHEIKDFQRSQLFTKLSWQSIHSQLEMFKRFKLDSLLSSARLIFFK